MLEDKRKCVVIILIISDYGLYIKFENIICTQYRYVNVYSILPVKSSKTNTGLKIFAVTRPDL